MAESHALRVHELAVLWRTGILARAANCRFLALLGMTILGWMTIFGWDDSFWVNWFGWIVGFIAGLEAPRHPKSGTK
jgi:hypothetical protein